MINEINKIKKKLRKHMKENQIDDLLNHTDIWNRNNVPKEGIDILLKNGFRISTDAAEMINGGSHMWWYCREKKDIQKFGSGPNWYDQSSDTILTYEEALEKLERTIKEEKTMIEFPIEWN